MASDPVLIAYGAATGQGRAKPYWQRIGCAYPHEAGNGLTVVLDVLPMNGRIVLLELDAADDERIQRRAEQLALAQTDGGTS